MKRRFALFTAALIMAAPTLALAADAIHIGYVNMQQVLEESKLGKLAQGTLKEKFGPRSEEFAKEEAAVRQQAATLERDKPLMSKDQISKKEAELKDKMDALQKQFSGVQQELAKEQQKLAQAIIGPAQEAVQALSKEKKMSVVFERSQAGLLFIDEGLDMTKEVIKRMDERTK